MGLASPEAPYRELWKAGRLPLCPLPFLWDVKNQFLNHWYLNFPDGKMNVVVLAFANVIGIFKTSLCYI